MGKPENFLSVQWVLGQLNDALWYSVANPWRHLLSVRFTVMLCILVVYLRGSTSKNVSNKKIKKHIHTSFKKTRKHTNTINNNILYNQNWLIRSPGRWQRKRQIWRGRLNRFLGHWVVLLCILVAKLTGLPSRSSNKEERNYVHMKTKRVNTKQYQTYQKP